MMKKHEIAGQKFGRLTAIRCVTLTPTKWLFRCDCGGEKIARYGHVKWGKTLSCGCLAREVASRKAKRHGMSDSSEYFIWSSMRERCNNEKSTSFKNYGARGIKVDPEWEKSFASFFAAVGPRPGPEYSLDRIDSDGDYVPGNVRWATPFAQGNNKRSNTVVSLNGAAMSISDWGRVFGVSQFLISRRLRRGWDILKALKEPVDKTELLFNGKPIAEIARETGISYSTLYARFKKYGTPFKENWT